MTNLLFENSLVNELNRLMPAMVGRLSLAAALGAAVGLERTLNDRPAGLRTGMFICFGSSLFTILSIEIGGPGNPDRIAANIITGIGFIGAGSIIHSKNTVVGLTSAATIFVIAAIGRRRAVCVRGICGSADSVVAAAAGQR
jgi:putative Mg2+ transporter-C (MgtC) family protein